MADIQNPTPRRRRRGAWWLHLPPIDWQALADQHRQASNADLFTRKGDKRPLEHVERQKRAKRDNAKARMRKAVLARREARRAKNAAKRKALSVRQRMALAMTPGAWHTRHEIQAACGLRKQDTQPRIVAMRNAGLVERIENPGHARVHVALETPRFLYQLTPAGEAYRRAAEWLE